MSLTALRARPSGPATVYTVATVDAAGRWSWRQMFLLLAVILGVVIMHAPIAGPASEISGAAERTSGEPTPSTNHDLPARAEHPAVTGTALVTTFASLVDADVIGAPDVSAGGHDSRPMSGLHDLMHLCLAVLVGLVVLGLAGFVAFLLYGLARSAAAALSAPVIVPPRPPPRMSVRLAQLCVLRN